MIESNHESIWHTDCTIECASDDSGSDLDRLPSTTGTRKNPAPDERNTNGCTGDLQERTKAVQPLRGQ